MKRVILSITLCVFVLSFFSCGDTNLAEKSVGAWQFSYHTSYDDGSKENATQTLEFSKDDDKDGGTFTEKEVGKLMGEDDDVHYTCKYTSTINGTWEVVAGDLQLIYDVTSLVVNTDKDDIDIKYDNTIDAIDAVSYSLETMTDISAEVAKAAQKEIYTNLFHAYSDSNDEGSVYKNLTIEGDNMSFETDDLGKVDLSKVN